MMTPPIDMVCRLLASGKNVISINGYSKPSHAEPQRLAAFLAQVGHETGRLAFLSEIWGPTEQQKRYDPPTDLARRLGNTRQGDGSLFRGHGAIQVTGRTNHRLMTQRLRIRFPDIRVPDFEAEPTKLATPYWGLMAAGEFWALKDLNRYADAGDFATMTRRINGGLNGLADRQAIYSAALPACLLNWS